MRGGDDIAVSTQQADADRAAAQLEALAGDLAGQGFDAHVIRDGQELNLSVVNRSVPAVRGKVNAGPADDGTWWFRWLRGDRIAPLADVETAAFKIAYVLSPAQGERRLCKPVNLAREENFDART
jgi:hypothetical protein